MMMIKKKPLVDELVDYLKRNLKKGYTRESLRWALINQGYSRMEVENALKKVDIELANEAPVLKTRPEIKHEFEDITVDKEKKSWFKRIFGN